MSRSKTLPQPAPKVGALARLTQNILGIDPYRSRAAKGIDTPARPWLMEGVAAGGVALSAILAGVGVVGLIYGESPLSKLGAGILLGGTILTEIAAARLPVHIQKRFSEGAWSKATIALFGFVALTSWNLTASHFGMVAVEDASLRDRRAPLEREAAAADSAREVAEEALRAHDEEARAERETMGLALRGAYQSGYISSSTRNAREAAADRAERREELAEAVAITRAAERAAERALAAAPGPRPDHEKWGFALILEICKGLLTWFATASERRVRVPSGPNQGPMWALSGSDPRSMSAAERRELKRWAASTLASIRHLEAARA